MSPVASGGQAQSFLDECPLAFPGSTPGIRYYTPPPERRFVGNPKIWSTSGKSCHGEAAYADGEAVKTAFYGYASPPDDGFGVKESTKLSDAQLLEFAEGFQTAYSLHPRQSYLPQDGSCNLLSSAPLGAFHSQYAHTQALPTIATAPTAVLPEHSLSVEPTSYPPVETVTTYYQLQPEATSKVLPVKEVDSYANSYGRCLSPVAERPRWTVYSYHSALPNNGRRNKGFRWCTARICRDWVIPALDKVFTALALACKCEIDPSLESKYVFPPYPGTPGIVPTTYHTVCASCGDVVDTTQPPPIPCAPISITTPSLAHQQTCQDSRIPLPAFECLPPLRSSLASSQPERRKRRINDQLAPPLNHPTDSDGLIALPAFKLESR